MSNEEIKVLAREYAEEICTMENSCDEIWREIGVCQEQEKAENLIRFLLRRFYIAEKRKVEEEYHEAEVFCNHIDPCGDSWDAWYAQKSVLERLFPDLGKEARNEKSGSLLPSSASGSSTSCD